MFAGKPLSPSKYVQHAPITGWNHGLEITPQAAEHDTPVVVSRSRCVRIAGKGRAGKVTTRSLNWRGGRQRKFSQKRASGTDCAEGNKLGNNRA
jgi:hypothetical protein